MAKIHDTQTDSQLYKQTNKGLPDHLVARDRQYAMRQPTRERRPLTLCPTEIVKNHAALMTTDTIGVRKDFLYGHNAFMELNCVKKHIHVIYALSSGGSPPHFRVLAH